MSQQDQISDFSRYFAPNQKVYLVNVSEERNSDIYESLSGVVSSSHTDSLELRSTHGGHGIYDTAHGKTTYKLTSEALGSGIQVLADLTGITAGTILQFRMHGTLELFQRRIVPRIEYSAPIHQLRGNFPLSFFKKEWKRIMDQLLANGALPGLVLEKSAFNLSAGGLGLKVIAKSPLAPLSLLFVALDEGLPVCAIAETVWEKRADEGISCGFRFIHILKSDQERINKLISEETLKKGGTPLDYKRNWVLVDKMVADDRKK